MTWLIVLSGIIVCIGRPGGAECPSGVILEMRPASVAVEYGGSVSDINCKTSATQVVGMGWESPFGGTQLTDNVTSINFTLTNVADWEAKSQCFVTLPNDHQCSSTLPVTVYKMPDNVSISAAASHLGPMMAGREYSMQCDIADVAPVQSLSVTWYKQNKVIHTQSYYSENKTPQQKSSVITVTPTGDDNGAQIFCEAQLNLGPMGPDPPMMASKPHKMNVLYPPTFVEPKTEFVDLVGVDKIVLNCTAMGNPPPVYSWQSSHPMQEKMEDKAVVTLYMLLPGTYNCTASNSIANKTKNFIVTQSPRDLSTFAPILGGGLALAAVLCGILLALVTPDGTFSTKEGSCIAGKTSSSGVI